MNETTLDTIGVQVDKYLPSYQELDDEALLAIVGQLTFRDVSYSAPLPRDYLVRLGRRLVDADRRIQAAVCANKEILSLAIDSANVTALVTLLAATLGFPPIAVPGATVALAVLLLRIGLISYCQGVDEPPTP